jgi:hypothetical protein
MHVDVGASDATRAAAERRRNAVVGIRRALGIRALAACAVFSLLFAGRCHAQVELPTAATPLDLNDDELEWRIGFIADRLEASRDNAAVWHWSWTGVGAGVLAWQIVEAEGDSNTDERGRHITEASKAFLSLVDLYWLRPMDARHGADELANMAQATHSQKLAKLRKAEDILERNAARADDRYSWQVHAVNVLLNFAGAGAIWATGGGDSEALVSAFAGIAAAELKFWTEPGQPLRDLADYKTLTGGMSMSAAPSEWRLVAIPGGLAVARTF